MKKYLLSIVAVLAFEAGFGQTMKASIGAGSSSNKIAIWLKPDVTQTPATFSTLQFNVAIPVGISPIPTLSVTANAFAGVTWIVDPAYVEGGFLNYNIYTASAGYALNITLNTEFQALEVAFNGGPAGSYVNTAHLVCLADGGINTGNALFYCTGTINSNGQSLYYARDANVQIFNGDSYKVNGTQTSFAKLIPAITLPVTITNYDVKCTEKGALITWSTTKEQNSDRFEIQRSTNSTDWVTIDKLTAAGNSDVQRNYQYLDLNGGTAFYRVSQVDKDGHFVYTAIKHTDCKASQFDITLYPVPARDQLTVVLRSDQSLKTDLRIIDISGRTVKTIPAQIVKGNNNIQLNVSELPGGQYLLTSSDPSIIINRKFTVIR